MMKYLLFTLMLILIYVPLTVLSAIFEPPLDATQLTRPQENSDLDGKGVILENGKIMIVEDPSQMFPPQGELI